MKKLYIFGFLLLTTGINKSIVEDKSLLLAEQQKAFTMKIAWFDFDDVFAQSLEYKDELDRVERAVKEKEGEFIKLKKEHDEAVAKLQNAGSTMKDDARERTIERIGELRQKIDIKRGSLDQYLQRERVTIQSKMMEKIYEAAATIAGAAGWDAVNPLIPKKLVFNSKMDITDEVIAELNKLYKPKKAEGEVKPSVQDKNEQKIEKKI